LPKALDVRTRADLPGTWRSKFELAQAASSVRPSPPDWWRVDFDDSDWEKVTVPQWRYGMESQKDKTTLSCILWYRTAFENVRPRSDRRVFLVFAGVDWEAQVWLNGTFLGTHKAYYEPFRFDVTSLLRDKNVLAVRVLGGPRFGAPVFEWPFLPDVPATEQRYVREFSMSVPGYQIGMLYCGGGFGIHREVFLETAASACVSEVFVRGDLPASEAKVVVETDSAVERELACEVQILPENFQGQSYARTATCRVPKGAGKQAMAVAMPAARLWQPTDPCLYRCRVILRDGDRVVDARDSLFGYRSFGIVTADKPRASLPEGMFLLNGQPVFLRGTDVSPSLNAFWYWNQQDKLLDALLMAKAANCNAIRACEHVLFAEVRELLDRLGVMSEQDQGGGHNTPKDGFTNGNTPEDVAELVRAGAILARVCYNNPGVVLLSVASETHFDPRGVVQAVRAVDPERILIPISGSMKDWGTAHDQPAGYTLPQECWNNMLDDFHCYNGWYSAKAQIWKFSRRRPPGRLVTVGEFGAEALDAYTTMARHYPPHFRPTPPITADALWGHVQVQKADPRQIIGFRGRRPANLGQYIEASQNYQADTLAELATGFRLSPRYIGGYFQFHFIDALPAHWPKSVVSHDFRPKKGYYEMAQVNQPVVPLFQITGQGKTLEVWLANDLPDPLANCRMTWAITAEGKTLAQGEKRADAPPLDAALIETISLSATAPDVPVVTISLTLTDATGTLLSRYQREVFLKAWRLQDALFPKS
jgi:beta-mannosidase